MRYEIKKILSCKILMISMIVAFIFSMAISYNAYANEKINLREFSAYIGDFSEQKYDVIEQKVMELQNKYEETQNADVMNEMFVYLTLDKDALNCHNVIEYRDSVISDSEIKIKTESGYYKRMNETINKLYGKKTNLVIGESETLNEVYDLFCVTDIVDIVFIIVIILFSSYLFLNEHNNNTFYMIKSSYRGGKLSYRNKIVVTLFFSKSSPNLCVNSSFSYVVLSTLLLSSRDLTEWSLVYHNTLSYQRFYDLHSIHYDHLEGLHQLI